MRTDKKPPQKADKKTPSRVYKRGVVGYSKKSALLEEAITHMNTGKYDRSSAALKELLSLDPHNTEARRLFATLHLRLGSLATARQAFESLAKEAIGRQDFWLAESLLREYLDAGPRCVPFLELLAHVYEEKGDTVAAVAELGKAIDILIEGPDSEDPKKPSELYAKVRELAPVSSVAFQFASLFDIQTGEFLGPPSGAPAAGTSLEVDASQPQDKLLPAIEESRASEVMPWEQFEGASPSPEVSPPTSSNAVIESLDVPDVLIDPAPVDLAPQELEVPPAESTGPIQEAHPLDQDLLPSIVAESPSPSGGHHDDGVGNPIVECSPFVDEGLTPRSSEERAAEVGSVITSSVGSPGLSSPMPWEQLENSTIKIEEVVPSTAPFAQSEGAPLLGSESVLAPSTTTQPEFVSDQLSSPAPVPDLTEPSESIFTAEPSTIPAVLPEPEAPTPSAVDSSSTVPFSWNTVFDGAWKFGLGTSSSSVPAASSKPGAEVQDARELESVQPEPAPEAAISAPTISSTPEPPVSFSDPEPLPASPLSTLSGEIASIVEADVARESDLPQPAAVHFQEEPSRPEEPPIHSIETPSSFKVALPVPLLSEPVEPARESEPIPFPSVTELQPVEPSPEASAPEPPRSVVLSDAPPAPEPVSTEPHEIPFTLLKTAPASPFSAASSDAPSASPASMDTLSHWSTGEAEVQPQRPSDKTQDLDTKKGEAPVVPPAPLPLVEESPESVAELSRSGGWDSAPSEMVAPVVEAVAPVVEKVVLEEDTRPDWVRKSESIAFVKLPPASPAAWEDSATESIHSTPEPARSIAASAVDVLFNSTGEKTPVRTQEPVASRRPRPRFAAKAARARIGISSFIGSCFSTTRSIVLLCVGLALFCVVLVAVGVGAVGLAWIVMEAPPSSVYHSLTTSPPQSFVDSRKNGYFLLLGFDVSEEQDPLQAGYERKVEGSDLQAASACMLGDEGKGMTTTGASANVVNGWFASADPAAQLKSQAAAVRSWAAQESLALRRYQRWLSMPFEDVGYGQILSPNCAHILLAHRLYLAEGFEQDLSTGLGRLETDMGSWRAVLGQSKTLMVKMLAATAVQDDAAIASGLLTRQDLDGTAIARLGKIVRPFDQVELSLRWPMQSHLAWATKAVTTSLKNDKAGDRPLHVALAAAMPLPVQRRSNAYADYYEAASKAVAEGRYTNLPKPSSFIRTPAVSPVDYVANPIEHIIGIEPLPSWDPYVGRMVETDARLRLASLQVWIRRGPQEENLLTRLAKAGQTHYDPFTGLPMLVNQQRGVMYSVGQDGKDQEGDPLSDVVATIPTTQSVALESSRSVSTRRSK
ncbi:MAG: tetratricopeptide repeat protein [Nitrospirota bacterium]|nr:tetratricopeptide repeat protein [Nitrospirota bacterium]